MKITFKKDNFKNLSLEKIGRFLVNLGSKTLSQIFVLFVVLIGINIISQKYFLRLDLTETKLYTLSQGTKDIITSLDQNVTIEMYYQEDIPPQLIKTRQDIIDLLGEYKRYSQGKLEFTVKDPNDPNFETQAKEAGLSEERYAAYLQKEEKYHAVSGFLGLSIQYKDKQEVINRLTDENVLNLEYEISSRIYKISTDDKQTVGFLTGHGEKGITGEYREIADLLRDQFNVEEVSIADGSPIDPEKVKVLVIGGPKSEFSQRDLFELDQYLLRGGRVLVLADQYNLPGQAPTMTQNENNLNEFLSHYGVEIEKSLVLDEASLPLQGYIFYPYFVRAESGNINKENPALTNLNTVSFLWASPIVQVGENENISFTSLIETTSKAWTEQGQTIDVDYTRNFLPTSEQKQFDLAVLVEGKVESKFKDSEIPELQQTQSEPASQMPLETGPQDNQEEITDKRTDETPRVDSGEDIKLVVVGDSEVPWEIQQGMEQNPIFVQNIVEWLSNADALLSIRSKNIQTRTLRTVTEGEKLLVKIANVSFVPLLLIIAGIGYNVWRKKRKSIV